MRTKVATFLLLVVLLSGCRNAPTSVKEADKEAQRLTTAFVKNNNELMKRVADHYRAQEYKHIELAARKAAADGDKPEDIEKAVTAAKKAVDTHYVNILSKFLAIQKDLKQATKLRAEISRYMDNKIDYKDLTDTILRLGEFVADKRASR